MSLHSEEMKAKLPGGFRAFRDLKMMVECNAEYAWAWQCNLAKVIEQQGHSEQVAHTLAAFQMIELFSVDVRQREEYKAMMHTWLQATAPEPEKTCPPGTYLYRTGKPLTVVQSERIAKISDQGVVTVGELTGEIYLDGRHVIYTDGKALVPADAFPVINIPKNTP